MGINVAQLLRAWAVREPERPALVCWEGGQRRTLTYGELDVRARTARAALRAQGLTEGARIAICVQNGLGFLDAFLGGLYQGMTVLPIPPMSAPPELAFRLKHARCAAIVHDASTRTLCDAARADAPSARPLAVSSLAEAAPSDEAPRDLPAQSIALVLYTSGTTGTPKGAQISHASLFTHTAALVHHVLNLSARDAVLAGLPLTHSYGIRMTLLAPWYAGARVVLLSRFSVEAVQACLHTEEISWFPGVPTMFHALANASSEPPPGRHLRWCLSAGAPLAREVRCKAEAALKAPVRQGYGLTEATFTSIASPEDTGAEDTVGRPVFGVEVRIVDEAGNVLPTDIPGEVWIRGQNVMAGYLDDEESTQGALGSGWLRSGDIGTLDAQGRLAIVDRIKDMILRGGFNVYPAEVEAVLLQHPAILDAVVVGLPDERYGEEVVAVVVERPGQRLEEEELNAFCRARLNAVKVPRLVGRTPSLPIGPSGKLQRRVVRDAVAQGRIALTPLSQTLP